MLITQSESKKVQNSESCIVWEYGIPSNCVSCGKVIICGRYPETKKVMNTKCEQIYFVVSGSGIIHSEKGDFNISRDDMYFFTKGEEYWVEGNELVVLLVNAPKWTPKQYQFVD